MAVLLRVAYDGTGFHGYAAQRPRADASPVRTVQGELEHALCTLYKETVSTKGASRTDAGVHAHGQLVSFTPSSEIPLPGLVRGLNSQLPDDIDILAAWEEPGDVDVRRGNSGKYYRYRIRCTEVADPLAARYEWHLARRLDPARMQEGAMHFLGTHDFGSFRSAGCQAKTTERTIQAVEVSWGAAATGPMADLGRLDAQIRTGEPAPGPAATWGPDWVELHVWGQAFLQNMVRIMVGTVVDIGLGRRSASDVVGLLKTPDRRRAGMTAPARGLILVEVIWQKEPAVRD